MYEVSINGDFGKSKKSSIKKFFAQNKLLVFLSACLLLGVFLGSMMVKIADKNTLKLINILFASELKERTSKALLEFFICSLSSAFVFIVASFFIGLSMCGSIFAPVVPFLRGICIGITEVYLYSLYGLKGLCFHSLIFLPGTFISSLAILLTTQESFRMSNKLSNLAFQKDTFNLSLYFKKYLIHNGFISLLILISTGVDWIANLIYLKLNIQFR